MDDLTRINGIGPATAKRLAEAGIDSFSALAMIEDGEDNQAAQLGVRPEWIAEAARRAPPANSEGKPPRPDVEQGAAGGAPADSGTGDPRTDTQGSSGTAHEAPSTDGGTPAETPGVGGGPDQDASAAPPETGEGQVDAELGELLRDFPLVLAAIRAYRAANPDCYPTGVRISARRDGFRRCNVAHTRAPVDHPGTRFPPEDLERLLAEPMLTVELI